MRPNRQLADGKLLREKRISARLDTAPGCKDQKRAHADGSCAETPKHDRFRSGRRPDWHDRLSPDGAIIF